MATQEVSNKNISRIVVVVLIAVVAVVALIVLQYFRTRNIYAVVGSRVIYKSDFAKVAEAKGSNELNDGIARELILDAALKNSAAKSGIKVDEKQVSFDNIQELEKKLEDKELHNLTVLQVQTYWGGAPKAQQAQAQQVAKQTLEQKALGWFEAKKSTTDILKLADNASHAYVNSPSFIAGTIINAPDIESFTPGQREALKNLKVGEHTPVTSSEAKFYFIDRVEARGTGAYSNWNQFGAAAYGKAKIFHTGWDYRRLLVVH